MRRFSLALAAVAVGALLFGLIAGGTAMGKPKKPKKHAEVVLLETKSASEAATCLATAGSKSKYLKENDGPKSKNDKGVTDEISREFPSKKKATAALASAPQCKKAGKKVKATVEKEE